MPIFRYTLSHFTFFWRSSESFLIYSRILFWSGMKFKSGQNCYRIIKRYPQKGKRVFQRGKLIEGFILIYGMRMIEWNADSIRNFDPFLSQLTPFPTGRIPLCVIILLCRLCTICKMGWLSVNDVNLLFELKLLASNGYIQISINLLNWIKSDMTINQFCQIHPVQFVRKFQPVYLHFVSDVRGKSSFAQQSTLFNPTFEHKWSQI